MTTYQEHYGRNVDRMPLILGSGNVPLSIAGFMQHRNGIIAQMGDVYADTSDLAAYADKKRGDEIKMILTVDAQGRITENGKKALELIAPSQKLSSGAVVLDNYDELNWSGVIPLSRKELEKYGLSGDLDKEQVLAHPFWRVALRHPEAVPSEFAYDKEFMKEAVGRTFSKMKNRHDYTQGMGVYLADAQKVPMMRAWCVDRLEKWSYTVGCKFDLDVDFGRLVGVAPEAQGASVGFVGAQDRDTEPALEIETSSQSETSLEQRIKSALDSGMAFTYNGVLYAPVREDSGLEIKE